MKFSEEELQQARNADLSEYLRNHGYNLKKEGKSYRVQDYSGGLIVTGNKWYWQSEQMGGKSIDFLTNVLEMPFRHAVQELQGVPVLPDADAPQRMNEPYQEQNTAVQLPERGNNERRVIGYLCQTRGILYANVKRLLQSGNLYQDTHGNAVFIIRDDAGNAVGAETHGTGTGQRYKNSTMHTGYGFSVRCGTPTGAMFFESAIDLLSYYQIHCTKLTHHDLISIAGVGNDRTIREYHQKYPDRKICLCCDNDTAGDNLIQKMWSGLDCRIYIHRPEHSHDWNDELRRVDAESEHENEHENECENVQKM